MSQQDAMLPLEETLEVEVSYPRALPSTSVMEGALAVWEVVMDLIDSGTPLDGLRFIAQYNIDGLRESIAVLERETP